MFLEGITLFCHEPTTALTSLRYFLTLEHAECERRRKARSYDPPDVPGYFEKVVWPSYEHHRDSTKAISGMRMLRGEAALLESAKAVAVEIIKKEDGVSPDGGSGVSGSAAGEVEQEQEGILNSGGGEGAGGQQELPTNAS